MPDRVVPMLPRRLCEDLCSLNPDVERCTFSVVFEMDDKANRVSEPWYGRGIMKSCAKLSYENAQYFLDNPNEELDASAFPEVTCGFKLDDLRICVQNLNNLALHLRQKRTDNGSVRIDQTKIGFTWDTETKTPNGFYAYVRKDAHKLIEEFMLLGNVAVAEKIHKTFPDLAFLRCHPPPNQEASEKLVKDMEAHGISIDTASSKTLANSLTKIVAEHLRRSPELRIPFESALSIFSVKIMNLAKYFCAGQQEYTRHYALAMPLYTHFTSPIRRYADLVVHRQLAAAIAGEDFAQSASQLGDQANECNERKVAAKLAGEEGSQIFFWSMVKMISEQSEFVMNGVVIDLVEFGVEVLIYETSMNVRCYYGEMEILKYKPKVIDNVIKSVDLDWSNDGKELGRDEKTNSPNASRDGLLRGTETLSLFSTVRVSVKAHKDPGRLMGKLLLPEKFK